MIGNNRSTSTPNGGETKFHEHQTMVLWTGGRVESLVGSVIGGMAWADHRFVCFVFCLPSIYQVVGFCFCSMVFIHVGSFSLCVFVMGFLSFSDKTKSEHVFHCRIMP